MARPASPHPTELELEILKVLWRQGPSTVRQVREALAPARKLAHTSVITIMNIMTDKGYLARDAEGNTHIFRAKVSAQVVRKRMLGDLVRRAFDGSTLAMILNLLDSSELKDGELAELRQRLDEKRKDA
ncbi:MAG TPA: BlaI/MecI/CopY family transcriptional regulator [Candidatus Sumerlaeota bacterium]|nr:BlaI/MecI/CopY family transcriptional regulator [Candidatus Sumerlaeota bacterium]HPS01157.1 BlaI/MecI/CopY family transcriptional regulator [Candidatus Sumerlaeota bacterium]